MTIWLRELSMASSPLPSHFYKLTPAKSQDILTWPIHGGDNSPLAASGTARQASGWAERRVAAGGFPFSHTHCHCCCCHGPFGGSGDDWAIWGWWVDLSFSHTLPLLRRFPGWYENGICPASAATCPSHHNWPK